MIQDAYYVAKPGGAFRPGEPAKIIDLVWVSPSGNDPRLCVHVIYEDGVEDYSVFDLLAGNIVTAEDVEKGNY